MWRFHGLVVVSVLLLLHCASANAQLGLGTDPMIGGIQMTCGGVPAFVYPAYSIGDMARAVPGQIMLDQRFFLLHPFMQRFIYGHECAHFLVGGNEAAADCTSITFGKKQGWLTGQGLQVLVNAFAMSPGDWTHLPGPARIKLFAACYQNANH